MAPSFSLPSFKPFFNSLLCLFKTGESPEVSSPFINVDGGKPFTPSNAFSDDGPTFQVVHPWPSM
jgi:hypothetical protein